MKLFDISVTEEGLEKFYKAITEEEYFPKERMALEPLTKPEPSRLEIAAILLAEVMTFPAAPGGTMGSVSKQAVEWADELIKANKDMK